MDKLSVIILVVSYFGVQCAKTDDSYLDALRKSHDADTINARDDYSSSYSDNSLGLTSGYDYSPNPKPDYGPPPSTGSGYGAPYPPTSYGAPGPFPPTSPGYGQPKPINMYNYAGPTHAYNLPEHGFEHWLLDKFKFKLDLFTIGKLLIKLIIFKKIVKFIALICLLLWLPKFQTKHMKMEDIASDEVDDDDDDDDDRQFSRGYSTGDNRLNEITRFTMTALEAFKNKQLQECEDNSDLYCRFNAMFDKIDDDYPYSRIAKFYLTGDSAYSSHHPDQTVNESTVVTKQKPIVSLNSTVRTSTEKIVSSKNGTKINDSNNSNSTKTKSA